MKVKELIEELKKFDPDSEVIIEGMYAVNNVTMVESFVSIEG